MFNLMSLRCEWKLICFAKWLTLLDLYSLGLKSSSFLARHKVWGLYMVEKKSKPKQKRLRFNWLLFPSMGQALKALDIFKLCTSNLQFIYSRLSVKRFRSESQNAQVRAPHIMVLKESLELIVKSKGGPLYPDVRAEICQTVPSWGLVEDCFD